MSEQTTGAKPTPNITEVSPNKQVETPAVDQTEWDILNNKGKGRFSPRED